jgi:hypothetical protein
VVAVMLGVALAFSVHLINASALGEFSSAVRAVNGQPDLELRSIQGTLDESLFGRVATHPQVALASPVLELSTYATGPDRKRLPVRVVGVDALTVAAMIAGPDAPAGPRRRPAGAAGAVHRVPEPRRRWPHSFPADWRALLALHCSCKARWRCVP